MGGIGSGNRLQWASRATVTEYRSLDVRRWAREGYLEPGRRFGWRWTCNGEETGSIRVEAHSGHVILDYRAREGGEWEPMRYSVPLTASPCNMGGTRQWFRCPAQGCGRRVALLYGGRVFACRHCHNLAYPSQREDASDRAARRADRIRAKFGWEPGILNGSGPKPKGMHWQTFERLRAEHDKLVESACRMMLSKLELAFD